MIMVPILAHTAMTLLFCAQPDAEQLARWIDDLGAPAFETRERAVRQLYAAGPAALAELDAVLDSGDFEAQLRAKDVIARIQKLFLVGANVTLKANRTEIAWTDSVTLEVHIHNPNSFDVHLPFLIKNRQSIDAAPVAEQVGNMIDVADFLAIQHESDRMIGLRVDDHRGQSTIEQALDIRVYDEPDSLLPPLQSFRMHLVGFNRGFARFPLLRTGTYRIQFIYTPEWDDPQLVEHGVGMVKSNELTIRVKDSAPQAIIEARREISVDLRRKGQTLTVHLTNTHDRPLGINLNLGDRQSPSFANLSWIHHSQDGQDRYAQIIPDARFVADRLIMIQPAQSVPCFSIDIAELKQQPQLSELFAKDRKPELSVAYSNLMDLQLLQSKQVAAPVSKEELKIIRERMPLPMFVGSVTSAKITIGE